MWLLDSPVRGVALFYTREIAGPNFPLQVATAT